MSWSMQIYTLMHQWSCLAQKVRNLQMHFSKGRTIFVVFIGITLNLNPLRANLTKWSNTLKQFVGKSRRIVWVCLTILWRWQAIKGLTSYLRDHFQIQIQIHFQWFLIFDDFKRKNYCGNTGMRSTISWRRSLSHRNHGCSHVNFGAYFQNTFSCEYLWKGCFFLLALGFLV